MLVLHHAWRSSASRRVRLSLELEEDYRGPIELVAVLQHPAEVDDAA